MDRLDALEAEIRELRGQVASLTDRKEFDAERINIRDADGTLRMTLSGLSRFPQEIVGFDDPIPHPRPVAGLLFFTDEGIECGGLIWTGKAEGDGYEQSCSLTFDRYREDQVVQLLAWSTDEHVTAGLLVNDVPDEPINLFMARRDRMIAELGQEEAQRLLGEENGFAQRVFVGRTTDGAAMVQLLDGMSRPRLRLSVSADGAVTAVTLDENGVTAPLS